jgi:hypothetical protein
MAIVVSLFALGAPAGAAPDGSAAPQPSVKTMHDDKAWADAEAAVRQALSKAKITPKEVRRSPTANVRVFAITTTDDRALFAAVADDKVYLSTHKHTNATVEAILKSERVLERTDVKASDIILLVHAFGVAPAAVKHTIDNSTMGTAVVPGFPPTLTNGKSGARLEVFALRPGRRGAEAQPKMHLFQGILTVSPAYKVKWKVESVDLPAPDEIP